jgi:hypothetical protein
LIDKPNYQNKKWLVLTLLLQQFLIKRTKRKCLKVLLCNTFKHFLGLSLSAKRSKLLVKSAASTFNFGLLNIRQLLANRLNRGLADRALHHRV